MIGAGSQTSENLFKDSLIYSNVVQIDTTNDEVHQDDGTDIGTLMGTGSWTYLWWVRLPNPSATDWPHQSQTHWAKGDNTFVPGDDFICFRSGSTDQAVLGLTQFFNVGDADPKQVRKAPWWFLNVRSGGSTIQLKSFTINALESPLKSGDLNNLDSNGNVTGNTYHPPNAPTTGFVCFALTCDASGTNRDFKLYINGVEIPASSGTDISNLNGYTEVTLASSTNFESHVGSATFNLQKNANLIASAFVVQFGPQAFWDSVLTQAEIKEIYYNHPTLTSNSGDYTSSGDLQRWYKFDEGTGTSVADSSGNSGQAFDLVNGPTWVKENLVS
jgi:hypothetical protein